MRSQNPKLYNSISIICGVWFLLTGALWVYFANLFISYPVGIVGVYFWYKARRIDPGNRMNRLALIIYALALLISVAALIVLLTAN